MKSFLTQANETISKIKKLYAHPIDVIVILGSGLGKSIDSSHFAVSIPYSDLPHFANTTVSGHSGQLHLGKVGKNHIAFLSGRFHLYEGHSEESIVYPIRVLKQLGAKKLLVTNAAGGINQEFTPGDLVLITDQINLTGRNPLIGHNIEELGPRFPDMTQAYCPNLQKLILKTAQNNHLSLKQGIYCGILGPSYETPAEIRMMRILGADMVGMSTIFEVIAANHMGLSVAGISCVTNLAAGMDHDKLDHKDVEIEAQKAAGKFSKLVSAFLESL